MLARARRSPALLGGDGGLGQGRVRLLEASEALQSLRELDQRLEPLAAGERHRALEQAHRAGHVAAREGAVPGAAEHVRCPGGERSRPSRREVRARRGSGSPARGGSRRSPRMRPIRRAARASRRTARGARLAAPSPSPGRRRPGSGCAGSGTRPGREATTPCRGRAPCARGSSGAARPSGGARRETAP